MNASREGIECSSRQLQLQDQAPSPFLTKTYDLVDDPSTDQVISWSHEKTTSSSSFVIWDPRTFSLIILPAYFKHNNFSNFIRQLNSYGFKKVNPDRWEFANAGFIRGQRHLMRNNMKRRAAPQMEQAVDTEEAGEIHRLRRDRQILMSELVKLRQLQKTTRGHMLSMEQRLRKTELKQEQTTRFLARAIRNPDFMHRLSHIKEMRQGGSGVTTDQCLCIDQGGAPSSSSAALCSFSENELQDYVDISGYDVLLDVDTCVVPIREHDQDQLLGEFLNDWIKEELRAVNVEEAYHQLVLDDAHLHI
ncbi:unnamed protein product [Rhodiola kirilowii]